MVWQDIKATSTANLDEELRALLVKEAEYAHPPPPSAHGADDDGSASIRRQVCQWSYECVDRFRVDREVVHLSMHYFDRYHAVWWGAEASPPSAEPSQLLALASLYLACKLRGVAAATASPCSDDDRASARLRFQECCDLLRGAASPRLLEGMERSLLAALRWRLHPPTPADFLCRFTRLLAPSLPDGAAADAGWSVFELAQYQIELAAYSPELCRGWSPSAVALAAVLNALDSRIAGTDRIIVPSRVRRSFLRRLRCFGGGFGGDDAAVLVWQARVILKTLCPKTIILSGQEAGADGDDPPPTTSIPGDATFAPIPSHAAPSLLAYELPSCTSPVGVDTDRL